MFEFIRIQYIMGNMTAEQVQACAPSWITNEQAMKIIMEVR